MIEIKIMITEEENLRLKTMAENRGTTVERILEMFAADVTCSERSNGSDERGLALDWLDRNEFNW